VSTRLEAVKVLKKESYEGADDLMTKDESELYGKDTPDEQPEPELEDDMDEIPF